MTKLIISTLGRFRSDRRALAALEYALIASLVAVGLVAALGTFKTALVNAFTAMGNAL